MAKRRATSTVALSALLSVPPTAAATAGAATGALSHEIVDSARLRFLAIGDWGGLDRPPYYTEEQRETAGGMARVAASADDATPPDRPGASFVLSLGDNFYWSGVRDDDDAETRFRETFEGSYHHPELQVPWYVIAGNHDHHGDVGRQLQFSDVSDRWNFPDYNHRVVREFSSSDDTGPPVKVEIIMIDTVHLAGNHRLISEDEFLAELDDPPPEPASDDASTKRAADALDWIEDALRTSDTDYLLVAGHYPIYSACYHGGNGHLIRHLDPLLKRYGATAYVSGHEHCQFHYAHDGVDYLLSGTGARCCYGSTSGDKEPLPRGGELAFLLADSTNFSGSSGVRGGFLSFDVTGEGMVASFHKEDGDVLYETTLSPRDDRFRGGKDGGRVVVS